MAAGLVGSRRVRRHPHHRHRSAPRAASPAVPVLLGPGPHHKHMDGSSVTGMSGFAEPPLLLLDRGRNTLHTISKVLCRSLGSILWSYDVLQLAKQLPKTRPVLLFQPRTAALIKIKISSPHFLLGQWVSCMATLVPARSMLSERQCSQPAPPQRKFRDLLS